MEAGALQPCHTAPMLAPWILRQRVQTPGWLDAATLRSTNRLILEGNACLISQFLCYYATTQPDNLANEADLLVTIFRYSKDDLRVLCNRALLQELGQFRCGLPLAQPRARDVAEIHIDQKVSAN